MKSPLKQPLRYLATATAIPALLLIGGQTLAAPQQSETGDVEPQISDVLGMPAQQQATTTRVDNPPRFETGSLNDAWLQGKIEMAFTLNRHLNPFRIDTDVAGSTVTLSGTVESEIDSQLAEEIARSFEEVDDVDNRLTANAEIIDARQTAAGERGHWRQDVADMTTTAIVKAKLLANGETKGLDIDVSTKDDVVYLKGEVTTAEERNLAELIAGNTDGVDRVENNLEVGDS